MLSSVFGKSFNAGKCKTLLRLAISRVKLLRNKRDMQVKQMRRELGQLLQAKQELTARIRVEHVFREQNIMAAYEILELFSELLVVRLPIIESQRQCPIDLREAIASLIFAAPRCADLPELQQISSLFAVKYGKDFAAAATELRPDCGVNRLVIEKLSVRAPSDEVRLKLMKEIAEEQGVGWDAAACEAEFRKAPADLLDGPNRFMGATVHYQEPFKPNSNMTSEYCFQNKARMDDTESLPFTLPDPPSASQSPSALNNSLSANKQNAEELHAYELAREEGYKAAADAARAAALSAERAAAAAVAVASLATKSFARMHSDTSKRSTSESGSASDEDDYRKENMMQRGAHTREHNNNYFQVRMDSFDTHLGIPTPEPMHDIETAVKPLFDEYPEEEVRQTRAHRGAFRKPVDVDDYTSDEDRSDSTERSESPLRRRCNFKDDNAIDQSLRKAQPFDSFKHDVHGSRKMPQHAADPHGNGYHRNRESARGPPRFDSDDNTHPSPRVRVAMRHGNGPHIDEYERQQSDKSRGFSTQTGAHRAPPRRAPPSLSQDGLVGTNKVAPHVHPKLPSYDDLATRFEALRSRS